uniref:Uncharacterized protein n=1 Tax=Cucumis melo TaxID=3656 RepID=A0A9I9DLJ2_CUCME
MDMKGSIFQRIFFYNTEKVHGDNGTLMNEELRGRRHKVNEASISRPSFELAKQRHAVYFV